MEWLAAIYRGYEQRFCDNVSRIYYLIMANMQQLWFSITLLFLYSLSLTVPDQTI